MNVYVARNSKELIFPENSMELHVTPWSFLVETFIETMEYMKLSMETMTDLLHFPWKPGQYL